MADAHPLDAAIATLTADVPRITDAMKNFCSVLAAADLTDDRVEPHELASLLGLAKVVLKCINAHVLATPDEWAVKHPQGDDETGAARIESLTRYKACYALRQQLGTASGAKATKLLGRAFLRATSCWEDGVAAAVNDELAKGNHRFPPRTVHAFLESWATAVGDGVGGGSDGDGADDGISSLVWAADFNAALQARRLAREAEVKERRERLEDQECESQSLPSVLREALVPDEDERMGGDAEEEDDDDDGPRVIELLPGGKVVGSSPAPGS